MRSLLVWSARPLVGKTTVAAGLAQKLAFEGRRSGLIRMDSQGDEGAAADARFLSSLPFVEKTPPTPLSAAAAAAAASELGKAGAVAILEASAGAAPALAADLAPSLVIVARYGADWEQEAAAAAEQAPLGLVLTAVPRHSLDITAEAVRRKGLRPLALLPEDRLLLSPTIGEIAQALDAKVLVDGEGLSTVIESLVIAPIAADQGYAHLARWSNKAVICRYDKPDLLLAALSAEAQCLVLTGGSPPLGYVTDRAANDGVPVLLVPDDTVAAVNKLEELYDWTRFGASAKLRRIGELLEAQLDYQLLLEAVAS